MKKVYICSSLRQENYDHVTKLLAQLPAAIYLRPQTAEKLAAKREDTVESDVALMKHADEIWVLGRIGRDCSWEIGWAAAMNKRVRVLIDETNRATIEDDWMLRHGEVNKTLSFYDAVYGFVDDCEKERVNGAS